MEAEKTLRYPIGTLEEQEYFNAPFSEALKTELITGIKFLPNNLEMAISNLDAAHLHIPYRPGGWSVAQLIHHVADSHINAYTRFKLVLTEENPVIRTYDQDAWAQLADNTSTPVNVSLTLLHALHTRWVALLKSMSVEQWDRTCFHPEKNEKLSAWSLLKSYSWHGKHHTAHITEFRKRQHL